MRTLIIILILGFLLMGCLEDRSHYSFSKETPDGCMVSCVGSVEGSGLSCDWDHKDCTKEGRR
jgi:hypothetical protein